MREKVVSETRDIARDRLINYRLERIEVLKDSLKKNVSSVNEEVATLRELSKEIAALRELRYMQ